MPPATRLTCPPRSTIWSLSSLPTMRINPAVADLFAFRFEDFELLNYDPHPHIKAPVAV